MNHLACNMHIRYHGYLHTFFLWIWNIELCHAMKMHMMAKYYTWKKKTFAIKMIVFSNSKTFNCYLQWISGGSGVYNALFFLLKTCRLVVGKISCWMVCEMAPVHMNTQNVDWHINASVWAASWHLPYTPWHEMPSKTSVRTPKTLIIPSILTCLSTYPD